MKVRDAITLVEALGWFQVRQRGSHRIFQHPTRPGIVVIAGKPSAELKPGTWSEVQKQAGLR
jgi:predicted RNA binding protein YcfA (HicA-like mRNA interferase family)